MTPTCNRCDGPLEPLGRLGNYEWLRCRNCHAEHHRELPEDSEPTDLDPDDTAE